MLIVSTQLVTFSFHMLSNFAGTWEKNGCIWSKLSNIRWFFNSPVMHNARKVNLPDLPRIPESFPLLLCLSEGVKKGKRDKIASYLKGVPVIQLHFQREKCLLGLSVLLWILFFKGFFKEKKKKKRRNNMDLYKWNLSIILKNHLDLSDEINEFNKGLGSKKNDQKPL